MLMTFLSVTLVLAGAAVAGLMLAKQAQGLRRDLKPQPIRIERETSRQRRR